MSEGTWPNTMDSLRRTFGKYPETEIRTILGGTAAKVYSFDLEKLTPIGDKIGPSLSDIAAEA